MKKLIMLRGLPASGKSTWAKEMARKSDWKRVNKDDLRAMLDSGKWSKKNEDYILQIRDCIVGDSLSADGNVIVDDTNFHPKHEQRLREIAAKFDAEFEIKDFDADVEECIKRDASRANGVGERVIRDMWRQFVIPKIVWPEDRDQKEKVVLCDLDGTLANISGRSPYDASSCEKDGFFADVWDVVKSFGLPVIFCSGREDKYAEQTTAWIETHCSDVQLEGLCMRKAGDSRKDWLVKFEMLCDEIMPNFNPVAVFDDRNQVVDMWRKQGLRVYQVAEGNF